VQQSTVTGCPPRRPTDPADKMISAYENLARASSGRTPTEEGVDRAGDQAWGRLVVAVRGDLPLDPVVHRRQGLSLAGSVPSGSMRLG
ncbi:hypothetical protein ACFWB2_43670, partial [Streptomyces virginiae]|uniref:hypothetical protein n=1 Tax=Streptomyces virginiae TaxID=1961 RepID=UPI0036B95DA8